MKKYLFLVAIATTMFLKSCTTVDSASVGIKFHKWSADAEKQGGVLGTVRGFVWFNPFTQKVYQYPLYIQRVDYDEIQVNTRDGAIFRISPTIAYRLDPDKAIDIFLTYRTNLRRIEQGYMHTSIFEAYRTTGNRFTSDSLMSNRGIFEAEVRQRLEETLTSEGFIVTEFTAQIMPPSSLVEAIDARNRAIQEALRAENQILTARAQAQIAIAQAEGQAQALKIQADGKAYYNRTVAASLSQLLVQQATIDKWNGQLPTYTGGGAIPFLNIR